MHSRYTRRTARDRAVPGLYWACIGGVWAILVVAYLFTIGPVSPIEVFAFVLIGVASSVVWLNGIRHLAMWATVPLWRPRRAPAVRSDAASRPRTPDDGARVALLYCTADDFNPGALRTSMRQSRPVTTVILDDSSNAVTQRQVDLFAVEEGARVIRRAHRTGFKAGNLNNGISQLSGAFDYFVILDSDAVVPPNFVVRALQDFADNPTAGIVQGRQRAARATTAFATAFRGLLGTHVAVSQLARSRTGFAAFTGRGAMISTASLRAAGPVPEVVTEDAALSFELREAGFDIVYDHHLVCTEDYPVDYHAFRTQHTKTVEGAIEFLHRSWSRIARSRLTVPEKIDLTLELLLVPLMAVAGLVLVLATVLLAAVGGASHQPIWAIWMTGLCATAPLLPETARLLRRGSLMGALAFLSMAGALYGSTLVLTLRASAKVVLGGRAAFHVTPKRVLRGKRWKALLPLRLELVVATLSTGAALALTGTIEPVLPLAAPVLAAVGFASLGSAPAPERMAASVRLRG